MGFFDFLGSGIVDSVGKVADELVTSDEERLEKANEKLKTELNYKIESKKIDNDYEAEITKRNESDNANGNFLTKSARPITLYLILFLILVMIFGGLFGVVIDKSYIDLVQILALTVFSFYFGGKTIEAVKHGKIL